MYVYVLTESYNSADWAARDSRVRDCRYKMYVLTESYSSADWAARDSQVRDCQYRIKKWLLRSETTVGQKNVAHPALGDKSKIYLSPPHIKLGLIKISVKAMDEESEGFD
jgi:hypothetical protein